MKETHRGGVARDTLFVGRCHGIEQSPIGDAALLGGGSRDRTSGDPHSATVNYQNADADLNVKLTWVAVEWRTCDLMVDKVLCAD